MMTLTKTPTKIAIKPQNLNSTDCRELLQASFLQAVLEGLEDGILIVNAMGELVHANASAHLICSQLNQENRPANFVSPLIWQLCQSLLDSHGLPSEQLMILSDEIVLNQSHIFRVRVRLVNLPGFQIPYFLVTIENRSESQRNSAIAEVKKYDLTPREAEIWCLYRGNSSYKDIAAKLYITMNTVKKHMKNIHAKRQAFLEK
ncbi:LuxR C-terminal-related transcriptional regulator [Calothrix sp. PCC 7507]|uniref:helix-turn-helix transcriptional regulator n=1 Tax=Calothrix sp. PCC 7507 TaxID=99598 RepID=UPI00029F1142|nr:LuxR C-terminal-related transcriptional regulator [Calothrix sp. PCC 7507]AFY34557.1 LuxR family transcriptional regulator [Calothrix sp. PCC 7507]